MTRVLVCGDNHAGSILGLTPPDWWRSDLKETQAPLWQWWKDKLEGYGPFDAMIHTGDMIDGPGYKDTLGHLATKIDTQAEIAARSLEAAGVKANRIISVYGTPFHTVGSFSYENLVADLLGASRPRDTAFLDLQGLRVQVRHVAGASGAPYHQGTPILRDSLQDLIDAATSDQEPADLVIRGHVHYASRAEVGNRVGVTAPCLQWPGSIFGRRMRGTYYHVGFGVIEVSGPGDWTYRPVLMDLKIVKKREWTCLT